MKGYESCVVDRSPRPRYNLTSTPAAQKTDRTRAGEALLRTLLAYKRGEPRGVARDGQLANPKKRPPAVSAASAKY